MAQKVTRIPGTGGGAKNVLGQARKLNKARVAGAAALGTAALGGAVIAATSKKDQEKQAAVGLLVETGIDFDTAVDMVEKKASELDKQAFLVETGMGYLGAKKGDKVGGSVTGLGAGALAGTAAFGATHSLGATIAAGAAGGFAGGKLYSAVKGALVGKKKHEAK